MVKFFVIVSIFAITFVSCDQSVKTKNTEKRIISTYFLPTLDKWKTETFPFPISFAPSIPYKGSEEIRFAPGWSQPSSNEYWTYAFLWYLEGNPKVDSQIIKSNLNAYYAGLINSNIQEKQIPKSLLFSPEISIRKTKTEDQDFETFNGTIRILDYMMQKPITFNIIIHLKHCSEPESTFVFHEISPKPFGDSVWRQLDQIWKGFKCNNKD